MAFWERLWRFLDWVMAALLLAMIILVFTNVVLRYGFDSGLRQSVELSRLGLVWLVMLGAAIALRQDDHLAVTEVSDTLLPKWVPFLRRAAYLVILTAALMLFWGAYRQMNANWGNISQLTGLPSALFYLAGVVSAVLMIFIAAVRVFSPDLLKLKSRIGEPE